MRNGQEIVKKFAQERGWDTQAPDDTAKSVCIEAAELLELFQWSSPTAEEIKKNPKMLNDVANELADVFVYALELANLLDLDADKIVETKLRFAAKKYPVELVRGRLGEKYSAAHERYLKIKHEHRKKKHG